MENLIKVALFLILIYSPDIYKFYKSGYRKASGASYFTVVFNMGARGEYRIFRKLEKLPGYIKILTNLYIPNSQGKTTEIDLLVITQYGIYVIESKNWGGYIIGNDADQYWLQKIGRHRHRHYNPIMQNRGHMNALKRLLGDAERPYFHNVVVFSNRCNIRGVHSNTPGSFLINENRISTMTEWVSMGRQIFSTDKVDSIYKSLQQYTLAGRKVKREHIKNIKKNH